MNEKTNNNLLGNKNFRLILLSISIFILSMAVFSRLIILSYRNRFSQNVKVDENTQVLSLSDTLTGNEPQLLLPEIFPDELPIYPNAKLENYWISDSDSITGISVVWNTTDKLSDIVDYYKNSFGANNWNTRIVLDDGNSLTMSFDKGTYDGFIGVTEDDKVVIISLTVGVYNK